MCTYVTEPEVTKRYNFSFRMSPPAFFLPSWQHSSSLRDIFWNAECILVLGNRRVQGKQYLEILKLI